MKPRRNSVRPHSDSLKLGGGPGVGTDADMGELGSEGRRDVVSGVDSAV